MSDLRPFELTIDPVGLQTKDSLCFRIKVQNTSNQQLVWDREFSMFLQWIVSEGTTWARATDLEGAGAPSANRLIKIEPGAATTKLVYLTKGFLACDFPPSEFARKTLDGEVIPLPTVREVTTRFVISPDATRLLLFIRYEADGSRMDAFRRACDWDPRDHGVWMGEQESNAIGLELREGDKEQLKFAGSFDPWSFEYQLFKTGGKP